jgi:hypothetical protein
MSVNDEKAQAALAARARKAGRQEFEQEMIEALGNDVMRDIVADSRRSSPLVPRSPLAAELGQGPTAPKPAVGNGRGWIDAVPLPSSPPGQRYVDAQLDAAAALDRAELEKKLKR